MGAFFVRWRFAGGEEDIGQERGSAISRNSRIKGYVFAKQQHSLV
jgi:hypothetical protein